jgi:hypothetical protein
MDQRALDRSFCDLSLSHSRSSLLLFAYFEQSDDCSKGSQEPDKQLTSPEVMALSNSSD